MTSSLQGIGIYGVLSSMALSAAAFISSYFLALGLTLVGLYCAAKAIFKGIDFKSAVREREQFTLKEGLIIKPFNPESMPVLIELIKTWLTHHPDYKIEKERAESRRMQRR